MTHDELLDRIAQKGLEPHGNVMPTHLVLALRAVVELHKPWNFGCSHCINIEGGYMSYPCPTILQIEKEIK